MYYNLLRGKMLVTVENKVIYVPAKKKKVAAPKPQPVEDEEYDY